MTNPVVVKISYYTKKRRIRQLHSFGMYQTGQYEYRGNITEADIKKLARLQKRGELTYYIDNHFSVRGNKYREVFFRNYKPVIGDLYFCAYCGKLIRKKNITIDHIYPVGRVRKSMSLQRKLKRRGIETVNDPRNLTPSCAKCNGHKAAKGGLWVMRGKLGQHQWIWAVRHILRLGIIGGIAVSVYDGTIDVNRLMNEMHYILIVFEKYIQKVGILVIN